MNKNTLNTRAQIENTCRDLYNQKIAIYYNQCEYNKVEADNIERVTWPNHKGGREVSSQNFNNISQYLAILKSGAYQLLLFDYSIIRCSFNFDLSGKIQSQNLLWWPCPIKNTAEWADSRLGWMEGIKQDLDGIIEVEQLNMRTPFRVDFDINKDDPVHPRSHIHLQHHKTRVNCNSPICFNLFVKNIFELFYPDTIVSYNNWHFLKYSVINSSKNVQYLNETVVSF